MSLIYFLKMNFFIELFDGFFKELDDVYHDVSAVMAECMVQGADMIAMKVRSLLYSKKFSQSSGRWRWHRSS
jgi:hypothetical protein